LEHSELIFEALMLNSPVAIVALDLDGKVDTCNPAFEKLFGYLHEELIGNHLDLLISTPETYYETSNYTKRISIHGETIRTTGDITVSIGISLYPEDGSDGEQI